MNFPKGTVYPNIALFAPMCSGKSTAAKQMVADHGYVRMPFAQGVREVIVDMVNTFLEQEDLYPMGIDHIDQHKPVFRPMLQWVGTELVREHLGMKDYWIERLLRKVEQHDGPVVVDDMRFPNEARALKDAGFVFMYVKADENLRFDNYLASTDYLPSEVGPKWEAANKHPSESHYEEIKRIAGDDLIIVHNSYDFETFEENIDMAVAEAVHMGRK